VSVADEAHEAVQARMAAYGPPAVNHGCTADLWTAYLRRRGLLDEDCQGLDAEDVCWLNVLQKISREANERKRDNLVDVVGYAVNVDLIQGGE
jgi:hypothetical protein